MYTCMYSVPRTIVLFLLHTCYLATLLGLRVRNCEALDPETLADLLAH